MQASAASQRLDTNRVVVMQSTHSQHTVGSSSASSIIATEAALQFLSKETGSLHQPDSPVIDEILETCAGINCDHLSLDVPFRIFDRYARSLRRIREGHLSISENGQLKSFTKQKDISMPLALLLNKPPETVALIVKSSEHVFIFDCHKRDDTTGAYIAIYDSVESAVDRLRNIWPGVESAGYLAVVRSGLSLVKLPPLENVSLCLQVDALRQLASKQAKELSELRSKLTIHEQASLPFSKQQVQPSRSLSAIKDANAAALLETTTFFCCICHEPVNNNSLCFEVGGCGHKVCLKCAAPFLDSHLFHPEMNVGHLKCPVSECRCVLEKSDIEKVMDRIEQQAASTRNGVHH